MDFMKKSYIINFLSFLMSFHLFAQKSSEQALKIIEKIDKNMFAKTQVVTSEMVVYGKRKKRIIKSRGYSKGVENNYTEYLFPEREKGTKMLKLGNRLWIYSPYTDRTIQLSGHLLRQSVMGSDLSYEDMMEERKLSEIFAKYLARLTLDPPIHLLYSFVCLIVPAFAFCSFSDAGLLVCSLCPHSIRNEGAFLKSQQ